MKFGTLDCIVTRTGPDSPAQVAWRWTGLWHVARLTHEWFEVLGASFPWTGRRGDRIVLHFLDPRSRQTVEPGCPVEVIGQDALMQAVTVAEPGAYAALALAFEGANAAWWRFVRQAVRTLERAGLARRREAEMFSWSWLRPIGWAQRTSDRFGAAILMVSELRRLERLRREAHALPQDLYGVGAATAWARHAGFAQARLIRRIRSMLTATARRIAESTIRPQDGTQPRLARAVVRTTARDYVDRLMVMVMARAAGAYRQDLVGTGPVAELGRILRTMGPTAVAQARMAIERERSKVKVYVDGPDGKSVDVSDEGDRIIAPGIDLGPALHDLAAHRRAAVRGNGKGG